MTAHEVTPASLDRDTYNDRFRLLGLWQENGLTLGQRASLIEHYSDQEWQDEEAEQFYSAIFAEMQLHAGEFVGVFTRYEHGTNIEVLLTSSEADPIKPFTVGAVVLNTPNTLDVSERLPAWKQFSYGFDLFLPSDSTRPHIAYRTPDINLTDIRHIQGPGQYQPLEVDLVIGNQMLAEKVELLVNAGRMSAKEGRDISLALALLAEVHGVDPVTLPSLSGEIQDSRNYYDGLMEILVKQLTVGRTAAAQVAAVLGVSRSEVEQLDEIFKSMPADDYSTSMHVRTSSYPNSKIASLDSNLAHFSLGIHGLERDSNELETRMIPMVRLYLQAIERYQRATTR